MKRNIALAIALVVSLGLLSLQAFAQDSFRVGDSVEAKRGSEWVQGRIESVEGRRVKVRFGNGKYDFQIYETPTSAIRAPGAAAREAKENQLREAFRADALNKYLQTVRQFAPFYDEKYISGGAPNNPAEWQKAVNDLAELDALCKTKYADVTNDLSHYLREGIVDNRYQVWCEIAARRSELEKAARVAAAKNQITLTVTEDNLRFAFNHQKNRVPDETQRLIYERAQWKQEQMPKYQPRFAEYGIEMPADFFAGVERRADELKKLIEESAPRRAWEQPPFRDAVVEAFIKSRYATEYRGAKILNIGLDYNTWVERKGLSYVGSDSTYRYYKVEYNSYKRGWVLMKLPNQPFCQASEWIVGRGTKGMVVVSLGGSGIFMKCP